MPQVAAATLAVIGGPIVALLILRSSGAVTSTVPLIAAGVMLSIGASCAGAAYWKTRPDSGDLLFGDLMVWGWLRRWRLERRLASAVKLLGLKSHSIGGGTVDLDPDRHVQLLEDLATSLEARDQYTHGHSRRVARHASMIATRMGLGREQVARIRAAAAVHDVGKIETPAVIIRKPGRLTDEEYAVVKRHPAAGARMVTGLGDEELVQMVRHHHERLDGMGYPDRLAADEIPLGARIIAVADTFDALTSRRSYRSAMSHKAALGVLSAEAGSQLDPDAVHAFSSYYSGHRLVAVWALVANGSQRLTSLLPGELNLGGAATAAKISAATFAAAVAGSAVIQAPVGGQQPSGSSSSAATTQDTRLVAVSSPGSRLSEQGTRGDRRSAESRGTPGGRSPGGGGGGSGPGTSPVPPGESTGNPESDPGAGGGSGQGEPSLPNSPATGPIKSTLDAVGGLADNVPPLPPPPNLKPLVPKLPNLPKLPTGGSGGS